MASEYSISEAIKIGKLSQVLANATNLKNRLFTGNALDDEWPVTIYQVWKPISIRYAANPDDSTLRQVTEWLIQLCGPLVQIAERTIGGIGAGLATITGPSNQNVNIGSNATFSISVTSPTSYTIQWYANGVIIPGATGATYKVVSAQSSQSGTKYFAVVTNTAGVQLSAVATLTVTATLIGSWYAGSTDYSTQLEANNDSVVFSGTFNITSGQPLVVPLPAGVTDYIVIRYPNTETTKTNYANPTGGIDTGTVPGVALNTNAFGAYKYIFSRTGNQFGINNVSGQVTFS